LASVNGRTVARNLADGVNKSRRPLKDFEGLPITKKQVLLRSLTIMGEGNFMGWRN